MDVKECIVKARNELSKATQRLREYGHEKSAKILEDLFPIVLPDLIEGHQISPVHHPAHVVSLMSEILLGEKATEDEVKLGVVTALLHDVALGRAGEGKIRKADIDAAFQESIQKGEEKVEEGVRSRRRHMELGAEIADRVLHAYNACFGDAFSDKEMAEIRRLIGIHDNPSVQEYELRRKTQSGAVWVFFPEDRLAMFLREADRLWMLTEEGIKTDLERDCKAAREKVRKNGADPDQAAVDPKKRVDDNIQRHRDEAVIYQKTLPGWLFVRYGFKDGALYRTGTGYSVFGRSQDTLRRLLKDGTFQRFVGSLRCLGGR